MLNKKYKHLHNHRLHHGSRWDTCSWTCEWSHRLDRASKCLHFDRHCLDSPLTLPSNFCHRIPVHNCKNSRLYHLCTLHARRDYIFCIRQFRAGSDLLRSPRHNHKCNRRYDPYRYLDHRDCCHIRWYSPHNSCRWHLGRRGTHIYQDFKNLFLLHSIKYEKNIPKIIDFKSSS